MTYSAEGLMPGLRWHNHGFNRNLKVIGAIALVMLVLFALAMLVLLLLGPKGNANLPLDASMVWAPMGPMVPLVLMMLMSWAIRSSFARSINSSSANGKPVVYVIHEDGVKVNTPDSIADNQWSHFVRSVITPEGVLLYPQKLAFHWLPKTAFASEADFNRFLSLVAANTKSSRLG